MHSANLLKTSLNADAKAEFPTQHVKALAELGFLGMLVDTRYDGGGMDTVSYVLAMERSRRIDSSVSVIMSLTILGMLWN